MTNAMEKSPLWQRTFAESNDHNVTRLVTSLRGARDRVGHLTSRITASLPILTMHDLSHLDGLWTVAGTIAGEEFALNPLEGYLFGSAVLLHDAALCFEAYSGGKKAVRETVQWKDAYKRRKTNQGEVNIDTVDFEALRSLHAKRAASFATKLWDAEKDPQYIIDDADLRTQYGPLIGEIASSHHWNIDQVAERFSVPRPPAAFLPLGWTADPLKVACLLRAADAGHMDSSRAPTFLLKILDMNCISTAHWVAQNHLGQLTVKDNDSTQLVVASTAPFRQDEAPGWWIAFDLVAQLDKELKQCDAVLASSTAQKRSFACKGVAAAGNVRELARYIETDGWEPTNSSVHVSDVTALVSKLGGERLYGTDADRLAIALREMVQNAADAISARRVIGTDPSFEGNIRIRLRHEDANGRYVLQVDDDGVGMSPTTLSDDLLDFGKSFWASERASREFPGIHAAGHSPRGRFGIGFFSIFMAATSVHVFSRRFDKGLEDVRCLSFDNGLSLRPTLTAREPADLGMDVCTRVELVLKPEVLSDPNRIKIPCNILGQKGFHVPFMSYMAAIVSGIDVPISVEMNGVRAQVHKGFPPSPKDRAEWLRTLSYVSAGVNEPSATFVDAMTPRLREIRDGNTCYGLAAISIGRAGPCDFLSAKSVGGFAVRDSIDSFVGLIDHLPNSVQREPGEMAAPRSAVEAWLSEQVDLLGDSLGPVESVRASYSLSYFDYDPIDVLQGIPVRTQTGVSFWRLQDLSALLHAGNRLGFRVFNYGTPRLEQHGEQYTINGFATCLVMGTGKFNEAATSATGPTNPKSLIGVLYRALVAQGANLTWTTHPDLYQGPFSKCDCLEVRI